MIFAQGLKYYVFTVILLTVIIILNIIYSTYKSNLDNKAFQISDRVEYLPVRINQTRNSCKNLKNKQFSVNIDGVTYPKRVPLYHNRYINFKCLNSSQNVKTILMWTKFKGSPLIDYGFGLRKPFENLNCPVTNCELTNDRSKFSQSDLVLFHLRNNIDFIPSRAFSAQRYVHVIYESPIHCHLCDRHENVFNFSSTYRLDSDFMSVYWTDSGLYWSENSNYDTSKDFLLNKNSFSAALISNCNSNFRMKYLDELKKFISIDIYGKCGQACPNDKDCRKHIADNYKFFFLFENSLCRDYVTEKFFDTLKFDIVPVVLGMADYSYYIPKSGFINALDFKSPRDLASYLSFLSNNASAYNEYFKWKKYLKVDEKIVKGGYLCEMCIKLHLEDQFGYIEKKRLTNVKQKYGLYENCYQENFQNVVEFTWKNLTGDIRSYYMSPEKRK